MKRLFYWLKINLGFSRKESRGFLLVIPVLLFLSFIPGLVKKLQEPQAFDILVYQNQLDSLEQLGWKLVFSNQPTFNPSDTVSKASKNYNDTRKIPFSEADSITLQIASGVGPALAGRIIRYKMRLGGFYYPDQLSEIYGLEQETIDGLWEYFDFDPLIFSSIQINSDSVPGLSSHPYISYGQAKVIIAYRNQHGDYSSSDELLNIKIFKPEWEAKLTPYLDFSIPEK